MFKTNLTSTLSLTLAGLFLVAPMADARWTSVGSAGTLDPMDDARAYSYSSYLFGLGSPSDWINANYNITDVPNLNHGDGFTMNLRYFDGGSNDQVYAVLYRIDRLTGSIAYLLSFDSDRSSQGGWHNGTVGNCSPSWNFDFERYAFGVEVWIRGRGAIASVDVGGVIC